MTRDTAQPARHANRPRWRVPAACLLTVLVGACAAEAQAGSAMEALRATGQAVFHVLNDDTKTGDAEARRRKLMSVIGERFSYEEMSKRSLGTHWNRLASVERQEFVGLFKRLLANTYLEKLEGHGSEQIEYLSERHEEGYAEVRTRIVSGKGSLPMDFRLVEQDGEWRVYDIIVDGISLVSNYRGQFNRFLRVYSYPELVAKLKERAG